MVNLEYSMDVSKNTCFTRLRHIVIFDLRPFRFIGMRGRVILLWNSIFL